MAIERRNRRNSNNKEQNNQNELGSPVHVCCVYAVEETSVFCSLLLLLRRIISEADLFCHSQSSQFVVISSFHRHANATTT